MSDLECMGNNVQMKRIHPICCHWQKAAKAHQSGSKHLSPEIDTVPTCTYLEQLQSKPSTTTVHLLDACPKHAERPTKLHRFKRNTQT